MLKQGDRINNYLLIDCIGKGSFGEVWSARHHIFNDEVAIKIPTDQQFVRNLQREGIVVHGMKHQNVVRVLDLDPYASPPYLIMELIKGPSLRQAIDHYKDKFPIAAAIRITRGILHALSESHKNNLIHRDIKPANVLLAHQLDDLSSINEADVKVTDFGLGKINGSVTQSIMQSGSLLTEDGKNIAGTLAYMAPEQKDGAEADMQSDIYSAGIVLFEMLTGSRPHGADLPGHLRSDVPAVIDSVFQQCYTRKERRYSSAEQMIADLNDHACGLSAKSSGTSPGVRNSEYKEVIHQPAAPHRSNTQQGRDGKRVVPPTPGTRHKHKCPSCSKDVNHDDHFCIYCGDQLVESVPKCSACNSYVHKDDRFCIFCGKDLRILS